MLANAASVACSSAHESSRSRRAVAIANETAGSSRTCHPRQPCTLTARIMATLRFVALTLGYQMLLIHESCGSWGCRNVLAIPRSTDVRCCETVEQSAVLMWSRALLFSCGVMPLWSRVLL